MHSYINELNSNRIDIYKKEHGFIIADYNRERGSMQSYHGREILELLQNADDEMTESLPKEASISFRDGFLRISNYGEPFSKDGIKSLTISDLSPKRKKAETYIGNKGTGFRSILGWTQEIYIHSGDLHVKFSEKFSRSVVEELLGADIEEDEYKAATLVFPEWIESIEDESKYTTDIIIKTKRDDAVAKDIETQLKAIDQNILLFLNKMDTLLIDMPDYQAKYTKHDTDGIVTLTKTVNGKTSEDSWRLFKKAGLTYDEDAEKDKPYSIVLAHRDGKPLSVSEQKLYSFFKTDVEFPYQFLLHATFLLNQDRNHLIKGSTGNEDILNAAAELMVDAAICLAKEQVANYEIIKLLVPSPTYWSGDLDGYDYNSFLVNTAKYKPVFPNVNGEYESDGPSLVYNENGISKFITGDGFNTLLKYTGADEPLVSAFLRKVTSYTHYKYNYMCSAVNKWLDNRILKATTKTKKISLMKEAAYTAGVFLQQYKDSLKIDKHKIPYFFFDEAYEQIKSRYVYYSEGDTAISKPPACVSVQFLHAEMCHAIKKFFDENSLE